MYHIILPIYVTINHTHWSDPCFLFQDSAYEVKDVLGEPPLWEEDNCRMYMHMNFTAKTKVSDDNMFFTEITHGTGKGCELTVNCCCIVKHLDNGILYSLSELMFWWNTFCDLQ
jgi:hypothetical protein